MIQYWAIERTSVCVESNDRYNIFDAGETRHLMLKASRFPYPLRARLHGSMLPLQRLPATAANGDGEEQKLGYTPSISKEYVGI